MCSTPFAARCVVGYVRGVIPNCRALSVLSRMPPAFPHKHIARFPFAFPVCEQYVNAQCRDRVNAGFPSCARACPLPSCLPRLPSRRPHVHPHAACPVPARPALPSRPERVPRAQRDRPAPYPHPECVPPCRPPAATPCRASLCRPPASLASSHAVPCPHSAVCGFTASLPRARHPPNPPNLSILPPPTIPLIPIPLVMRHGSRKALVTDSRPHVSPGQSTSPGTGFRDDVPRYGSKTHKPWSEHPSSSDSDIRDNALTCNDSNSGTRFGREKDAAKPSHKYLIT